MTLDLLALSPHPDDAELFCGGTLAAAAASGRRVAIADLTRGEMASNGTVEGRRAHSLAACAELGILPERPQLGLPDGGLYAGDATQVAAIASLLRVLRPRVLLAPWGADRHPDHVAGHELALRATHLAGLKKAPLDKDPHRVERLYFYPCHGEADRYDLYVDVSAVFSLWRKALDCYRDQFERDDGAVKTPINAPEFLRHQESRREAWGRRAGVRHAEPFVARDAHAVDVASLFPGIVP